jgi:hypothetical protein
VLEEVQKRLDKNPQAMRQRRETAEHPFATLKMRMGATHFLMKRLPKVATEMALHVLAYNLTRVMNIMGIQPLISRHSEVANNGCFTSSCSSNILRQNVFTRPRPKPDMLGLKSRSAAVRAMLRWGSTGGRQPVPKANLPARMYENSL